jgi:hypothetical protein
MKLQENDFLLFPNLRIGFRFFFDMLLISIVFYLQIYEETLPFILSLVILLFFILFNWVKKINITKEFKGSELKWESTNMEEIKEAYRRVRKISGISTKKGSVFLYFFIAFFLTMFISPILLESKNSLLLPLYIDVIVIGFVVYGSGNRSIWTPKGFKKKLEILISTNDYIVKKWGDRYFIEPQFHLEENKDKYVPLDAKLLLKMKDNPPEGFLTIQYQLSMNSVQSKLYPYLYAVIVAKKEFDLIDKFQKRKKEIVERLNDIKVNLTLQAKHAEKDVEILIIRQRTTKTSGYYTKNKIIKRIIEASIIIFEEFLKEPV